ncbi:MAG TPA: hypothetical protein VFR23_16425 [Jiangellaceae bacterium]|nr:hypothetical protein [Jiangellaceae bacterium]
MGTTRSTGSMSRRDPPDVGDLPEMFLAVYADVSQPGQINLGDQLQP